MSVGATGVIGPTDGQTTYTDRRTDSQTDESFHSSTQ